MIFVDLREFEAVALHLSRDHRKLELNKAATRLAAMTPMDIFAARDTLRSLWSGDIFTVHRTKDFLREAYGIELIDLYMVEETRHALRNLAPGMRFRWMRLIGGELCVLFVDDVLGVFVEDIPPDCEDGERHHYLTRDEFVKSITKDGYLQVEFLDHNGPLQNAPYRP